MGGSCVVGAFLMIREGQIWYKYPQHCPGEQQFLEVLLTQGYTEAGAVTVICFIWIRGSR